MSALCRQTIVTVMHGAATPLVVLSVLVVPGSLGMGSPVVIQVSVISLTNSFSIAYLIVWFSVSSCYTGLYAWLLEDLCNIEFILAINVSLAGDDAEEDSSRTTSTTRSRSDTRSRSGTTRSRSGTTRSRSGTTRSRSGTTRSRSGTTRSRSGTTRSRSRSRGMSISGSIRREEAAAQYALITTGENIEQD